MSTKITKKKNPHNKKTHYFIQKFKILGIISPKKKSHKFRSLQISLVTWKRICNDYFKSGQLPKARIVEIVDTTNNHGIRIALKTQ